MATKTLALYNQMVGELAKCEDITKAKAIEDRALALRDFFGREQRGSEQQALMARARLIAAKRVGEILNAIPRKPGQRTDRQPAARRKAGSTELSKAWKTAGGESSALRRQRIADYPDELFSRFIQQKVDALVLRGLIRAVRTWERRHKKERPKPGGQLGKADIFQADIKTHRPKRSLQWVVTDPPYPKEYLPLYDDLARFCLDALDEGGSLLAMSGSAYLPDVIRRLAGKLVYRWTFAYLTTGPAATIFSVKVRAFWKPILWFTKGKCKRDDWVEDLIRSPGRDKLLHEWGQSEGGMFALMRQFVKPGDVVCDPFLGCGTTGVVAVNLGCDFVGFDIDADCIKTAKANVANA